MKYLITLLCFFSFHIAFAQHPVFYQINDESGLPSNEIYKVVQDSFGYVWIGCDAGLYRYDGFTYKQYSNAKQNGIAISFLQLDAKQRVWCKNFYGQIYRVDGDSLKMIHQTQTFNPSQPAFELDQKCNAWVVKNNKLIVYDENGDSLKAYGIGNENQQINGVKFFKGDLYLFYYDFSCVKFNIKNGLSEIVVKANLSENRTQSYMIIEHLNELYLLVELDNIKSYRLYKFNEKSLVDYYDFKLKNKNDRVYNVFSDGKEIWVTSSFGVFKLNDPDNSLFEKEKISSMLVDKEGEFWFSSLQSGLFVIPQMDVLKYNSTNSDLSDNALLVLKVIENEKLLLGSYQGNVFELDPAKRSLTEVYKNSLKHFSAVKSIERNNQFTIVSRGHFCVIDNKTHKEFYPLISNIRDFAICDDSIYMIHSGFLFKSSLAEVATEKKVNYLTVNEAGGKAIEYDDLHHLVYVLSGNGLYCFEPGSAQKTELLDGKVKILGSTLCYNNGVMWIAGISGGVYGIVDKKIKYHYTDKNYLKEKAVRTIGANGNLLWVCTENYLHRINIQNNEVGLFNSSQSVNPKDINAFTFNDNQVYLSTNKGLLTFPENMNWRNEILPSVRIVTVLLNDSILIKENGIVLPYDNYNFKVIVSGTAFKSRGHFSYEYRLIGLDSAWNGISAAAPYVLFSRIPSGDFVFQVRSVNEHGVFSTIKTLHIFVKTPFWQRWWFYVLIGLLASFCVAVFFNARIRFIKRKAELKNKLIASQLTALKSQMNPHFMFNALNSIQDLVLSHDVKNSNLYISKFSSLMRKILDASGKEKISLQDEIEILELYLELEKLRFGNEFEFKIINSRLIRTDDVLIPSMILQPFVENAIKHGLLHKKDKKELSIEFSLESTLICTIIDNGIGRKRSEEIKKRQSLGHQSFATQATEKRIELLNSYSDKKYSFEVVDLIYDEITAGTKVIINIPISDS